MKQINMTFTDVSKNSFKFYNMIQRNETEFTAEWGRIGQSPRFTDYLMSEWSDIFNAKTKKGYKVTYQTN